MRISRVAANFHQLGSNKNGNYKGIAGISGKFERAVSGPMDSSCRLEGKCQYMYVYVCTKET